MEIKNRFSDIVSPSQLLQVLIGFNPWWAGKTVDVPPFRRLALGKTRQLVEAPELRRAVLLAGPRRVGKSTILQQLAHDLISSGRSTKSILYCSLEHPVLKLVGLTAILQTYHEQIHPEGQPTLLLLDEIHYADDWSLHCKILIDHRPWCRIVATGSASVEHRQALTESGVGRWVTVSVPTLSFFEFLQVRQEQVPEVDRDLRPKDLLKASTGELATLAHTLRPLLPAFQRYLLVGGFPETARLSDLPLCQRLLREDVVERVLKRDMTTLFGVRNVADIERLFLYLCMHTGGILSVQECASSLGVTSTTVANHLALLEQAHLISKLPPLALGGKKVLKARNKYYLVDAALRNAVLLRGEEVLTDAVEMGLIVETAILRHLLAYHYQDRPAVGYWHDPAKHREIDLIIKSPNYTLPVEIKYRHQSEPNLGDGLAVYCASENVPLAYWITADESAFGVRRLPGLDTNIMRIPAHIFCYLLGQSEHRS